MLVSDVVNSTSTDFRTLLGNTGSDAAIIISWVDRVHKQCLHSSVYSHLNRSVQTVAMVVGTSSYAVTAVRRIVNVYNRSIDRILTPIAGIAGQAPESEQVEGAAGVQPMGLNDRADMQARLGSRFTEFYMKVGSNIVIYPTPTRTDTLEVTSELNVTTVNALGTTLTIPDDGLDMMVAGVNMYMAQYLGRAQDVQNWAGIYAKLMQGELVV